MYRGFPVFLVATLITITAVPVFAELLLQRSHLYGVSKTLNNDDLLEEVQEGRKRIDAAKRKSKQS